MRTKRSRSLPPLMSINLAVACLIIAGWTIQTSDRMERALAFARADLEANRESNDYVQLKNLSDGALEVLKLPLEFKELNKALWVSYYQGDFAKSADIAEQMEKLLPRQFPTEYPLSGDFLIQWRAEIGNLRADANDYKGALKDYDEARAMQPLEESDRYVENYGKQFADYGKARIYAIQGKQAQAFESLDAVRESSGPGCGNCQEAQDVGDRRLKTVWAAATLPEGEAIETLLGLIEGDYVAPPSTPYCPVDPRSEKRYAAAEAAYMLGELYLRKSRKDLAKKAFEVSANASNDTLRRMSSSRLKQLL